MKITWNASERVRRTAIKASELKESGMTYAPLTKKLGFSREYTIALKQYGDQLRKESEEEPVTRIMADAVNGMVDQIKNHDR